MAIHASTALPLGASMTLSEARDFFNSKAFSNYRSSLEGKQRVTMNLLARFDNVLRGMNALGKVLAGRRR